MYVIDVWQICDGRVISREDALPLRVAVEAAWSDAGPVDVDFGQHRIASVSFLDEGVAVLCLQHDLDVIRRRIIVSNITAADRRLLNELIAKRVRQRLETANSKQA